MADEKVKAPLSVFTAADTIKYRKYQNQMAMYGKTPMARVKWVKAGKPQK